MLEIPKVHFDVSKNFGAGRWQTFRTVALPGTLLLVSGHPDLSVGSGALFTGVVMSWFSVRYGVAAGVLAVEHGPRVDVTSRRHGPAGMRGERVENKVQNRKRKL